MMMRARAAWAWRRRAGRGGRWRGMRGGVEERCWEQGAARQLMMFEECNEPESNPLGAQGDAPAASCRHVSFTVEFQHAHAGAQQPAAMIHACLLY